MLFFSPLPICQMWKIAAKIGIELKLVQKYSLEGLSATGVLTIAKKPQTCHIPRNSRVPVPGLPG